MISYDMNLFSNSDHVSSRLVELVRFVKVADTDNWHIGMHQHDDFCEWEYVVSGRGRYIIDSRDYEIKAGDLICINTGVAHAESSDPQEPLVSWKICCRMSPKGELDANTILPQGICPIIHSGEWGEALNRCYEDLNRELREQEKDYETMAIHLTEQAYILAMRIVAAKSEAMMTRNLSLAMQVKKYIDLHYAQKINLDILAKELHASKYYIAHEMKAEYKCSPIDYLITLRMGEAQNLLNTTELSVGEIARRVGYENVSYFNHLFAKRMGVTPSEFRGRNMRMIHSSIGSTTLPI